MGGAAVIKPPKAAAEADMLGVRIVKHDGKVYTINAVQYAFREAPIQEGGPIILHLLKEKDRASATNEPVMILTRVIEFEITDAFSTEEVDANKAERMKTPDANPLAGRPVGLVPSA